MLLSETLKRRKMDCQTIIASFLFLGSSKASKDFDGLKRIGITHIVNLAGKQYFPGSFQYKRAFFEDSQEATFVPLLQEIFDFIENAKTNGGRVLVHCQGGISRSPSVVIAYLMKMHNETYQDALDLVKRQRKCVRPNANFISQLRNL